MPNALKPKMIYFQANPSGYAPVNFEATVLRPLKCFREFFEVVLIDRNCDYDEVCQTHEPDIAIFDCGDEAPGSRLSITNMNTNRSVPRIGFMKGDAWSSSRIQCLYQIEDWDLEAVFEQGDLALKEYLPDLSDMIYYFPYFVDTDLYRDYGQDKLIPLLFIGDFERAAYPWRKKIKSALGSSFPMLVFPHPGYSSGYSSSYPLYGERYARTINASIIVPSGGAFNKQFLKKHLEILACRACLISDDTPAVRAFGLQDMENCVFADENDIVEKLHALFQHLEEIERITNEGFAFIHAHHSYKNRKQIIQWFELHKGLDADQKIIQTGLFEDLKMVRKDTGQASIIFNCQGEDRELVRKGDLSAASGDYHGALICYEQAGSFTSCIPDADLKSACCHLHTGTAGMAVSLAEKLNRHAYAHNSRKPDPIEWACLIIAVLCEGHASAAVQLAKSTASLSNREHEWARWAVAAAANDQELLRQSFGRIRENHFTHRSIHQPSHASFHEYILSVGAMLRASGRKNLAQKLLAEMNALPAERVETGPRLFPASPSGPDFDFEQALDMIREVTTLPVHRLVLKEQALRRMKGKGSLSYYSQALMLKIQRPYQMARSSEHRVLKLLRKHMKSILGFLTK